MEEQELFLKSKFVGKHHQIFCDWLTDIYDEGWFNIKVDYVGEQEYPAVVIHYDIKNENCIICEIDESFILKNFKIKHILDEENAELKKWLSSVVKEAKKYINL
jgi:hypothetical protein